MGSLIFETQTRVCSCSCFFVCLFLCVFLPKPLSWPWDFCRNTRARTPEVEDCPTSIAHAPGEPRVEPPAKKRRPPAKESRAAGSERSLCTPRIQCLRLCHFAHCSSYHGTGLKPLGFSGSWVSRVWFHPQPTKESWLPMFPKTRHAVGGRT